MSDIEIARAANKKPIQEIGDKIGIPTEHLLPYGHDKAKVSAFLFSWLSMVAHADSRLDQALRHYLQDRDDLALPVLAELAVDGNVDAQLMLARVRTGPPSPFLQRLTSVERRRLISGTVDGDVDAISGRVARERTGAVAEHGDDATYDDVVARAAGAGTPQEELRYLASLPAFPGAEQMERTLEACRTTIRTQNAPSILAASVAHRRHGPMAWTFVRSNWEELTTRFPHNSVPRLLSGITAVIDEATAHDITGFLAEHPVPQGGATIDQHLERMRISLDARARERSRLADQL